ncbi:hypothetical protein B5D82_17185 [Cognaticolwellia beringensis]|uniref:Uncharacterized protein n=1 Tax=Cognaticolwellia beringensis TaxID=1967665 RepID=A0A222GCC7_9GAMM|nr:hypothetical protein B5D82_17185 [Cognaticolwellia beringensis]
MFGLVLYRDRSINVVVSKLDLSVTDELDE